MMNAQQTSLVGALRNVGTGRKAHGGFVSNLFTMILFAIISMFLLIVLAFGTVIYAQVNTVQDDAQVTRASLGLISNAIKMSDKADAIGSMKGPEGRVLVLTEHTSNGNYETRFYLNNGHIMEEYSREDSAIRPDRAVVVADSSAFDFEIDGNLVTVTTDQGSISIAMRSSMGDA